MLKNYKILSNKMFFGSARRRYSQSESSFAVAVIGGAGGIGQPLSLLLKRNPLVSRLTVFDLANAKGVAADLSHVDYKSRTLGFEGMENLAAALKCANIVVVPAGVPRKPGQTRDDLFKVNAQVVAQVADMFALVCPEAFLAIITNPVNSTVPVAAEILKKHNVYDQNKLFGITTLDLVRARKFISESQFCDPQKLKVPVIGGHSGNTIVPLISQCSPEFKGEDPEIIKLTDRIQNGGTEIVEAKAGGGSATLSMAHAGAEFINSLLKALTGKSEVEEIAYVESCITDATFFASPLTLGIQGVTSVPELPPFSGYEGQLICAALPQIIKDIEQGVNFAKCFEITKSLPETNTCKGEKK